MKRKSQTIFCPIAENLSYFERHPTFTKRYTLKEYLYACSDSLPVMCVGTTEEHYFQKGASLIKSFVCETHCGPPVILILSGLLES